ncbi:hypothetical protein PVAND_010547 [Polypedilum vanderplanki]|uniref:Uncharacterized protein n=1 Tax=Polypedilum vanderplanki TaxID=319348 RepID=A0A9J6CFW6_POLVA|nr:hypothetical protein PVAND_010547 [Polypedilum vanderplanki]
MPYNGLLFEKLKALTSEENKFSIADSFKLSGAGENTICYIYCNHENEDEKKKRMPVSYVTKDLKKGKSLKLEWKVLCNFCIPGAEEKAKRWKKKEEKPLLLPKNPKIQKHSNLDNNEPINIEISAFMNFTSNNSTPITSFPNAISEIQKSLNFCLNTFMLECSATADPLTTLIERKADLGLRLNASVLNTLNFPKNLDVDESKKTGEIELGDQNRVSKSDSVETGISKIPSENVLEPERHLDIEQNKSINVDMDIDPVPEENEQGEQNPNENVETPRSSLENAEEKAINLAVGCLDSREVKALVLKARSVEVPGSIPA